MVYQYAPLSDSRIRLLALLQGRPDDALHCEIIETEFFSDHEITPSYEALSYVWGIQTNPQPLYIIQPDATLCGMMDLGSNLHLALRHIRHEHSRRLIWCDFICINQADLNERAREVARMADIYRKAEKAIVWVGPEADDSALAIKTIEYTGLQIRIEPQLRAWRTIPDADPKFKWEGQEIPYSPRELQAIQKLVARSWFKRLWVRQEVTLAKSSVVVVGNQELSWTHLIAAAAFLDSFIRLRGHANTEFGRNLFNIFEFGCLESYTDIMDILHACRACECTEDHDRVYALLGLLVSHHCLTIQPDYSKDAKHVYQDLVLQCYDQHQRLNILTLCESADLPSWVPDLQKLRLDTGLNTRVVQYCWASGEAAASLVLSKDNTIQVYGVRCGVLGKKVTPSIAKNCSPGVLRLAISRLVRVHMGHDISQWDMGRLEILAQGLLGSLWRERTGRKNHCSLPFALSELKEWALEDPESMSDNLPEEHESLILFNHMARVLLHGDACRWTQDGHIGLGFHACQEGDILYAVLGCRRLIALRKEPSGDRYRVVGKFDHPGYNDGEAFLGKLAASWKVNYRHWLLASNRPKFVHEDGSSQWQDPRLKHVALPHGWDEGQDQDGYPYWTRNDTSDEHSYSDPRLTFDELKERGINIEKLVII